MLRIAHVTFSGNGGAGIAARRISDALRAAGHDSTLIVAQDPPEGAKMAPPLPLQYTTSKAGRLALRFYKSRQRTIWTNSVGPGTRPEWLRPGVFDIVNLHWMGEGFLPANLLARAGRPVVWTMHDMWPFTGGCHYNEGCERFGDRCGACPQLGSQYEGDLSRLNWHIKARAYRKADIRLVSPSSWLAEEAQKSAVMGHCPVRVIRNTVDLSLFRPSNDRANLRSELGLPTDRRLVLVGSNISSVVSRKGSHFVQPFIDEMRRRMPADQIAFLTFGPQPQQDGVIAMDFISDETQMARIYAAVDIFLLPSVQDNLPNTIVECTACGTPAAGFRIGGVPEMIRHGETGVLADAFDPRELARGCAALLSDTAALERARTAARRMAEEMYDSLRVAGDYVALYQSILS